MTPQASCPNTNPADSLCSLSARPGLLYAGIQYIVRLQFKVYSTIFHAKHVSSRPDNPTRSIVSTCTAITGSILEPRFAGALMLKCSGTSNLEALLLPNCREYAPAPDTETLQQPSDSLVKC